MTLARDFKNARDCLSTADATAKISNEMLNSKLFAFAAEAKRDIDG
jgi:hypothetical protein